MLRLAGEGQIEEPVLERETAGIFLCMTGRAALVGDHLVMADSKPDTIGRAASDIYEGNEAGKLSEVIEELTGAPSVIDPTVLTELVEPAIAEHTRRSSVSGV